MEMIEQGSPEWHALRLGKVTASRVADVVARTKSGWGASRANYMAELIVERMTNVHTEGFKSAEMLWGNQVEPDARAAYEFLTDATVELASFVDHPTIVNSGASPDGLVVGQPGLVEFKCPNTATHIETLLGRAVPARYVTQTMWQLACCKEREWCDYVSFDPRMPEHLQMFVMRIHRDDEKIAELEGYVSAFLVELDAKVDQLRSLRLDGTPKKTTEAPVVRAPPPVSRDFLKEIKAVKTHKALKDWAAKNRLEVEQQSRAAEIWDAWFARERDFKSPPDILAAG